MCITSGCTVLLSGGNCYQCQLIYPTSKWCSTIPKLSQTRALQTYTLGWPYVEWLCYISFFLSSRASINRKLYYHDGICIIGFSYLSIQLFIYQMIVYMYGMPLLYVFCRGPYRYSGPFASTYALINIFSPPSLLVMMLLIVVCLVMRWV